jgi:hypothetical protein
MHSTPSFDYKIPSLQEQYTFWILCFAKISQKVLRLGPYPKLTSRGELYYCAAGVESAGAA